jgi:hypothetical protein
MYKYIYLYIYIYIYIYKNVYIYIYIYVYPCAWMNHKFVGVGRVVQGLLIIMMDA